MAISKIVLQEKFIGVQNYSSGPLDVGDCYDLALDYVLSPVNQSMNLAISRVDAFGNLFLIYGDSASAGGSAGVQADLGPSSQFASSLSISGCIQVDITTAGSTGEVFGTISIIGKGRSN